MDNSKIESEGVLSFQHYINYCEHLSASVNQRDKEPIWDGDLHAYKSEDLANPNHIGVVRIQVKATTCFESNDFAKFSVGVDELNSYFFDGGVLFVVVHVERSGNHCFYNTLTPVAISKLLQKAEGQKTTTITLGPLPTNEVDFEDEIIDFLNDCKAQHSYLPENYASFMDWNNKEPFSFSISAHGNINDGYEFLKLLTKKPRQVYKVLANCGMKYNIPLKEGKCYVNLKQDRLAKVTINGQQMYDHIQIEFSKGKQIVHVGHCLRFEEDSSNKSIDGKIHLNFEYRFQAKTLSDVIADLRFSLAVSEAKKFKIDRQSYSFDLIPDNKEAMKAQLSHLEDLKATFEKLHIKDDLALESIQPIETENGKGLIEAILHEKPLKLATKPNHICNVTLGNIMILLLAEYLPDGTIKLSDYFGEMEPRTYKNDRDEIIQSSPCSGLTPDFFMKVSNLNYERLVKSFSQCVAYDPDIYKHANYCLLSILNAYDKKKGSKIYMFNAIRDLAFWIYENDPDTSMNTIHRINCLQIIKRHQNLSEQEIESLYAILDTEPNDQIKFAAYLLLDQKSSAERYFNKLSEQEQQTIKEMPIWKFMDN